ncbi:MAG: DUF3306 domain-containing protein, partial [Motiliproteus sp.]|nr:DUF3306 domain-containing protein [Motiliproteus sp.]
MDEQSQAEGFLGRWSRLKQRGGVDGSASPGVSDVDSANLDSADLESTDLDNAAEVEKLLQSQPLSPEQSQQLSPDLSPKPSPGQLSEQSSLQQTESVEALTDEDMPDIETLTEDSDYSGFLSEGVSEALKRKAMRKLFHLPEFNIRDGLNDYDDDFSIF